MTCACTTAQADGGRTAERARGSSCRGNQNHSCMDDRSSPARMILISATHCLGRTFKRESKQGVHFEARRHFVHSVMHNSAETTPKGEVRHGPALNHNRKRQDLPRHCCILPHSVHVQVCDRWDGFLLENLTQRTQCARTKCSLRATPPNPQEQPPAYSNPSQPSPVAMTTGGSGVLEGRRLGVTRASARLLGKRASKRTAQLRLPVRKVPRYTQRQSSEI
jgi:hypothetical protein|mmetsp:Transcript_13112/g.24025  ORF Transcript_13112/g.24025 Transcript_13112/m.24025 type:complete len:221 (-) Transcript_13112:1116-1778(-)